MPMPTVLRAGRVPPKAAMNPVWLIFGLPSGRHFPFPVTWDLMGRCDEMSIDDLVE